MVEKSKKLKKGFVSEEDISSLLQRYTATTVLTLLQEVAQVPDVKIDWNALVKRTATGISNAREYQMLWRHLAYRDSLLERFDNVGEPLDDDSDLEYELEAFPAVSTEASVEAAACVKVLIASGSSSDASGTNGSTVEAPLTINIPNSQASRASSENSDLAGHIQGTNITVPVSVQKQPLPSVMSSENLDTNGTASGNLPPRRKRKPWSAAEDAELVAAVQKCGEGNWANILKGDFKGDRTASQLSQRWSIIRKRKGSISAGTGSQLSEAQLATRRVLSLALNMPMGDNLKSASSVNASTSSQVTSGNIVHSVAAETSSAGTQSQTLSHQDPTSSAAQRAGQAGSSKSRLAMKKPSTKPAMSPDSMVKAAAVAAGARIATPSDAASLLKAAQSKNAVHIMPGGGSLLKSSSPGTSQLPSNVHFIRTGLAAKPLSKYSVGPPNAPRPTPQVTGNSAKPVTPVVQSSQEDIVLGLGASSQAANAAASNSSNEFEVKAVEDGVNSSSDNSARIQKDHADVLCKEPIMEVNSNQTSVSSLEQVRGDQPGFSGDTSNGKADDDRSVSLGTKIIEGIQEDQRSVAIIAPNKQVTGEVAPPSSEDLKPLPCKTNAKATASDHPLINGRGDGESDAKMSNSTTKDLSNKVSEVKGLGQNWNRGEGGVQNMDVDENDVKRELKGGQGDLREMEADVNDVKRDLKSGHGGLENMDVDQNDVKSDSKTENGEK